MRNALIIFALVATLSSRALALPWGVLGEWNFDSDTVGNYPSGWTYAGSATNTFVQNGITGTPSAPNVLQREQSAASGFTQAIGSFTPYNFSATALNLEYEFDFNVKSHAADGS